MTPESAHAAAELLTRHWTAGTRLREIPEAIRPRTRDEGYAIQAQWMRRTAKPLFGWKIAATSTAGQRHINVDGPIAGRLLAETVLADGATLPLGTNLMRVVEVELAFRFGSTLPPRPTPYSVDEVMAAVATLHPALEIPDSRYEDFCVVGAPQLIADNACAHRFILGAATTRSWRNLDLAAVPVTGNVTGKSTHEGSSANALGDPRIALTWLVNELRGLGLPMQAGEAVTTGTCLTPIPVVPGDEVRARCGDLGELSVRLAA